MPEGTDNLERIIEGCRGVAHRLKETAGDPAFSGAEMQAVEGLTGQLEGLRDKFFMKTVAAVPATRKCLERVEKAHLAVDKCGDNVGDIPVGALKRAINELVEAAEELLEKAQMRGTTLT